MENELLEQDAASSTGALLAEEAQTVTESVQNFFERLASPVALYQLGIIILLVAASWGIKKLIEPRLRAHFASAGYLQSSLRLFIILTIGLIFLLFPSCQEIKHV